MKQPWLVAEELSIPGILQEAPPWLVNCWVSSLSMRILKVGTTESRLTFNPHYVEGLGVQNVRCLDRAADLKMILVWL